jgi:hypothetical protein
MELLEISVMYVLRKDLLLMKESQSTKPAYTLDRKVNWAHSRIWSMRAADAAGIPVRVRLCPQCVVPLRKEWKD